jgi:hypothetical protein
LAYKFAVPIIEENGKPFFLQKGLFTLYRCVAFFIGTLYVNYILIISKENKGICVVRTGYNSGHLYRIFYTVIYK